MSPLDAAVVRRKLEIITANLRLLQPIAGLDLETYRSDPYRRKATERMLQEIVEAATDINVHIVVRTGGRAPDGLHQSFFEAATCGVLSHDLAAALSPSAGLRNRLVHEYDAVDDAIVLEAVSETQQHYAHYVAAVERFLAGC